MKHLLFVSVIVLFAVSAQAADVNVSVRVGEPGFYGSIDIGNAPPPEVIYEKPVVIVPPRGRVEQPPLYLHVPPGQERNWSKHCQKYNACGRPVYFVRDKWYNDVYVPHYRERNRGYENKRDERRGKEEYDRGRGPERSDRDRERERGRERD